ncbi:MAG: hypothetical protein QOF52_1530 [Propionibacteriaceae bacterium]|jgi:hypothetical protein|nr:hypothetical protein [Propionibacteriaceae bacterium]
MAVSPQCASHREHSKDTAMVARSHDPVLLQRHHHALTLRH